VRADANPSSVSTAKGPARGKTQGFAAGPWSGGKKVSEVLQCAIYWGDAPVENPTVFVTGGKSCDRPGGDPRRSDRRRVLPGIPAHHFSGRRLLRRVPAGNPAALAQRMLDALADEERRQKMVEHGWQRVEAEFTFAAQSRQYQQLFDRLLRLSGGTTDRAKPPSTARARCRFSDRRHQNQSRTPSTPS